MPHLLPRSAADAAVPKASAVTSAATTYVAAASTSFASAFIPVAVTTTSAVDAFAFAAVTVPITIAYTTTTTLRTARTATAIAAADTASTASTATATQDWTHDRLGPRKRLDKLQFAIASTATTPTTTSENPVTNASAAFTRPIELALI